jgi:hypothetical protein
MAFGGMAAQKQTKEKKNQNVLSGGERNAS